MEKLDIESLLEKNPQVDREAIKRRQQRLIGKKSEPLKGNPASPYGGKKAAPDTRIQPALVRKSKRVAVAGTGSV